MRGITFLAHPVYVGGDLDVWVTNHLGNYKRLGDTRYTPFEGRHTIHILHTYFI